MYNIPNHNNPYHPRSTPSPAKLPPIEMVLAAKRRGAGLISQDGQTIYKNVYGEWQRAYWHEDGKAFSSWWSMGEAGPPLEVIVL